MPTKPKTPQLTEDSGYVSSSEALYAPSLSGGDPGLPMESFEDGSGGSDFSLFDPGFFGDLEDGLSLGFLDDEEGGDGTSGRLAKLSAPSEGDIPKPRRRRRAETLTKITAEDFPEGAERNSYLIIEAYANHLFATKAKVLDVDKAITFFFTIEDNGEDITFPLCCSVLNSRIDVLRLRLHYEWWLRGTIFTGPFPFLTVPVPDVISGEITYYSGQAGYALARECWVQPGIHESELIACVHELDDYSPEKLRECLHVLESRLLMSCQADRWYVTGRNPMQLNMRAEEIYGGQLLRGGTYHWSRLFGKSQS